MTDNPNSIVLIGGGLAAAKTAETLRDRGYDGPLHLLTGEAHRPYERPPLSKDVLVGDKPPDSVHVHGPDFYTDHDIELIVGDPAVDIDRNSGAVTTRSGRSLPFDRLLLATGAAPRQLPVTDDDLDGTLTLRTLDDARYLGERLRTAEHVTIVGAGWIGCEVATAARALDTEVTLVDPLATPLQRVLGPEVGTVFADLHRDHGVELRLGVGVVDAKGTGQAQQLTLSDQSTIDTNLVVVGIGVTPRTELAEKAGLEVDDGIVVDATLATGDGRIFAAGDVANAWHPSYERHLRVEHWANALNQGQTVAANMLGAGQPYDRLPYFFSDQYDLGMEYVGHAVDWDQVVFRGDADSREFIAFWLTRGQVVAAMNVNIWDVVDDLKRLIHSGDPVDPTRLADPTVLLAELASRAA